MTVLQELRERTGLSQYKLAAYLGVSRSLVSLAEKGLRDLPSYVLIKAVNMIEQLPENKIPDITAVNTGKSPELAAYHKRKIEYYKFSAEGLQRQLNEIKKSFERGSAGLELMNKLFNNKSIDHPNTETDVKWLSLQLDLTNYAIGKKGINRQEMLQCKIDVQLAYAAVHEAMLNNLIKSNENDHSLDGKPNCFQ